MKNLEKLDYSFLDLGLTGLKHFLMRGDFIYIHDIGHLLSKSKSTVYNYVNRLQEDGEIVTKNAMGKSYIQYTDELVKKFQIKREDGYYLHNLTVTSFLSGILYNFPDYRIHWGKEQDKHFDFKVKPHDQKALYPDAFFYNEKGERFSLEIEISQKAERKIKEKLIRYIERGSQYDKVIYFFSDMHLLLKFIVILKDIETTYVSNNQSEYRSMLKRKFILVHSSTINNLSQKMEFMSCIPSTDWERASLIKAIKGE